jgi:hypothetical protein
VTTEERCAEIEAALSENDHPGYLAEITWAIAQIRALTEELKTAERVAWDLQEANDRLREEREEDRRVFGRFCTIAKPGVLPPLEWDEEPGR